MSGSKSGNPSTLLESIRANIWWRVADGVGMMFGIGCRVRGLWRADLVVLWGSAVSEEIMVGWLGSSCIGTMRAGNVILRLMSEFKRRSIERISWRISFGSWVSIGMSIWW
jgi:hypothetical protein